MAQHRRVLADRPKYQRKVSREKFSPSASDSSATTLRYERVGLCGICLQDIEALQPGGLNPRHVDTGIPYRECPKRRNDR